MYSTCIIFHIVLKSPNMFSGRHNRKSLAPLEVLGAAVPHDVIQENATYIVEDHSENFVFDFDEGFLTSVYCTYVETYVPLTTPDEVIPVYISGDVFANLAVTTVFDDDAAVQAFITDKKLTEYTSMFTQKLPYLTCAGRICRRQFNNDRVRASSAARCAVTHAVTTGILHNIKTNTQIASNLNSQDEANVISFIQKKEQAYKYALGEVGEIAPAVQDQFVMRHSRMVLDPDGQEFLMRLIDQDADDRRTLQNLFAHILGDTYTNNVLDAEKMMRMRAALIMDANDGFVDMLGISRNGQPSASDRLVAGFANLFLVAKRRDVDSDALDALGKHAVLKRIAISTVIALLLKAANYSVVHMFMLSSDNMPRALVVTIFAIPGIATVKSMVGLAIASGYAKYVVGTTVGGLVMSALAYACHLAFSVVDVSIPTVGTMTDAALTAVVRGALIYMAPTLVKSIPHVIVTIGLLDLPSIGSLFNIPDTWLLYTLASIAVDVAFEGARLVADEWSAVTSTDKDIRVRDIFNACIRLMTSYPAVAMISLHSTARMVASQSMFYGLNETVYDRVFRGESEFYGNISDNAVRSFHVSCALLIFTMSNHYLFQPFLRSSAKKRLAQLVSTGGQWKSVVKVKAMFTGLVSGYGSLRETTALSLMAVGIPLHAADIGTDMLSFGVLLFFAKYHPDVLGYFPNAKDFITSTVTGMSLMSPSYTLLNNVAIPRFSALRDVTLGVSAALMARTLSLVSPDAKLDEELALNFFEFCLAGSAIRYGSTSLAGYLGNMVVPGGKRKVVRTKHLEPTRSKWTLAALVILAAGGGIGGYKIYTGTLGNAVEAVESSALTVYTGGSNVLHNTAGFVSELPRLVRISLPLSNRAWEYVQTDALVTVFDEFRAKDHRMTQSLARPGDTLSSLELIYGKSAVTNAMSDAINIYNASSGKRRNITTALLDRIAEIVVRGGASRPSEYTPSNTNAIVPMFGAHTHAHYACMILKASSVFVPSYQLVAVEITEYFEYTKFIVIDNTDNPHVANDKYGFHIYPGSPHIAYLTPQLLSPFAISTDDSALATDAYNFTKFLFTHAKRWVEGDCPPQDDTPWSITDTVPNTVHALKTNREYLRQMAVLMLAHHPAHFYTGLSLLKHVFTAYHGGDLIESYMKNPANADKISQRLTQYAVNKLVSVFGVGITDDPEDAEWYTCINDPHKCSLERALTMYQVLIANYNPMLTMCDPDFGNMQTHIESMNPSSRAAFFETIITPKNKYDMDAYLSMWAQVNIKHAATLAAIADNKDEQRINEDSINQLEQQKKDANKNGSGTAVPPGEPANLDVTGQPVGVPEPDGVPNPNPNGLTVTGEQVTKDNPRGSGSGMVPTTPAWVFIQTGTSASAETFIEMTVHSILTNNVDLAKARRELEAAAEEYEEFNRLFGGSTATNQLALSSGPPGNSDTGQLGSELKSVWGWFKGGNNILSNLHVTLNHNNITVTPYKGGTWMPSEVLELLRSNSETIWVLALYAFMHYVDFSTNVANAILLIPDVLKAPTVWAADIWAADVEARLISVHVQRRLTYAEPFPALSRLPGYGKYKSQVHAITARHAKHLREVHRDVMLDGRVRKSIAKARNTLFAFGDTLALYYQYIVNGILTNTIVPGNVLTPNVVRTIRRIIRSVYPESCLPTIVDATLAAVVAKTHRYAYDDSLHAANDARLTSVFLMPLISPLHVYLCGRANVLVLNSPVLLEGGEFALSIPAEGVTLDDGLVIHQHNYNDYLIMHHIMTEGARAVHRSCMRIGASLL